MISNKNEAYLLMEKLGAPQRLITHVQLVGEAAALIIDKLGSMNLEFDKQLVELGAAIHDAGKIKHPSELDGPGSNHEPDGEKMLLDAGVQPEVARCCMSHARFNKMECLLEELLVALSDKLWKGKRVNDLEERVIDGVADRLGKARWDIFTELDSTFEQIALSRDERLGRSK
ncbi:HD domain protein [hydrothermal vent metagenome]|uniref:HD domain protein n=1 Tax=hydrothermal vent metagenome TaxID=652676 RepID=A0A3B0XVQ3_9ZZZZ